MHALCLTTVRLSSDMWKVLYLTKTTHVEKIETTGD